MLILGLFKEFFPLLALGYLIGRFKPGLSSLIAVPLINFGVPISLMGLLLKSGMDWHFFEAFLMALFAIGLLITLMRVLPNMRSLFGSRCLLLGSVFGNSGYFGIPIALALLPSEALSFSIGYDLGATLLVWAIGPIIFTSTSSEVLQKGTWGSLLNALTRSPATKGLLGALLIRATPWSDQITSTLWIPSKIVIVLALMIIGIRLGSFSPPNHPNREGICFDLQSSLLVKLLIFPALMLVLTKAFSLPILMRDALVLQAATPTAISVLLLAEVSGKEQQVAASLVASSTLAALITVPIWSLVLRVLF